MPVNKKAFSRFFVFFLLYLLISKPLFAEDVIKTVVILPFDIHSKENAVHLQNAIYEGLAGQLGKAKNILLVERERLSKILEGKRIDDSLAKNVGKETDAAYVIMGSLTEIGESLSSDVRILDVRKGDFLPAIYAQGKGLEGIGALSVQISTDILVKMGAEQRIARIEFKGNRRIESSAISQVLRSVSGSVFSEANLAQDIKAIYKMGYFTDVTVQATDVPEGRVVTFVVQEKGIVSSVKRRRGSRHHHKGKATPESGENQV